MADDGKSTALAESSYVLVARDYADIAHLENPGVIERVLSSSRTEKVAYVSALLTSGLSKYALAGPKVAFAAMAVEALTDFGREVSEWIRTGRLPEDFSGRPSGYQTWVELLQEIDSNPIDADRLRAMKAMFLAANDVNATDGESIVAYQLFQVAKKLNSGELLLLRTIYASHKAGQQVQQSGAGTSPIVSLEWWARWVAGRMGHQLSALVLRDERALVEQGLFTPRHNPPRETVNQERLTDLGMRFCQKVESYETGPDTSP
jgi:hypothetical protein